MLNIAISVHQLLKFNILIKFEIQFFMFRHSHPQTPMLRPAVNRQPGFRRGTRRARQRREKHFRWLAGWLAAGWLAAPAADGWLAGWLLAA